MLYRVADYLRAPIIGSLTAIISELMGHLTMATKTLRNFLFLMLILCCIGFSGCSKGKDSEKQGSELNATQQEVKEAIEEFGKKPIGKARGAQALSLERDEVLDRALEKVDKN
jgi:hypothetical protein